MSDEETPMPPGMNLFAHPGHQLVVTGWITELNRIEMGWINTTEVSFQEDALVVDRATSLLCTVLNMARRIDYLEKQLNEFRYRLTDDGK